jgi:hypothetical protein
MCEVDLRNVLIVSNAHCKSTKLVDSIESLEWRKDLLLQNPIRCRWNDSLEFDSDVPTHTVYYTRNWILSSICVDCYYLLEIGLNPVVASWWCKCTYIKEEVGGSILGCGIFSQLDGKRARWSTTSCALALAGMSAFYLKKEKKQKEKRSAYTHSTHLKWGLQTLPSFWADYEVH